MPTWDVEQSDEFGVWYEGLDDRDAEAVDRVVAELTVQGPLLSRPLADTLDGSKFTNMKELRVQSAGKPLRIFFAFDPRRVALLLVGGDKTGGERFYEVMIAKADEIFAKHLAALKEAK